MLDLQDFKKIYKFSCHDIPHATHQPVLFTICNKEKLRILEFGCGIFSTILLSTMSNELGHNITSFENDPIWLEQVKQRVQNIEFILVNDWHTLFEKYSFDKYDVIFIDQAPWEARELTLEKLKDKTDFIVIHDSDFCPGYDINYDKYLKYYKIFMPLEPYPYKSGPPTLLGSNFYPCDIDINYGDFV